MLHQIKGHSGTSESIASNDILSQGWPTELCYAPEIVEILLGRLYPWKAKYASDCAILELQTLCCLNTIVHKARLTLYYEIFGQAIFS